MKIRQITSSQNDHAKRWRKLGSRKGREKYGALLVEGEHLLLEAIRAKWTVRSVLVADEETSVLERIPLTGDVPIYSLYPSNFSQLVDTQTPQGIAAEVMIPAVERYEPSHQEKVLLLDGIQDPGNLGAILRTAEATGIRDIWLGPGTVDPYNPKVVRSAMGSLFRSRLRRIDLRQAIADLQAQGFFVVSTNPRAEKTHFQCNYPNKTAVLLGNEGRGIHPDLEEMADAQVQIPMPGKVESLNVSVTAGILLYEMVRQEWEKK